MIRELSDAGRPFSRLLAAQLFSTRIVEVASGVCTAVLLYYCVSVLLYYLILYCYTPVQSGVCTVVWPPVQKGTNKKREWNQSKDFNGLRCKMKVGVLSAPIV